MMLEISDIDSWKNFFDVIFDSSTIVELKLDQDKCKISLLNNSHVAFYDVEYSKSFFDNYQVDDVESVLIFVEDFYKILKSSKKGDVMTLESDDANLRIIFENESNRRMFELPLGEDFGASPVPPSIEYDGSFDVLLDDLKAPVNDLDKIVKTDRFKMRLNDGVLNIVSPDDAMTQYKQEINVDTNISGDVIIQIDYISQLLKLSKINKVVEFKLGSDMPLSWKITSPFEDVVVSGLIAPILENNE